MFQFTFKSVLIPLSFLALSVFHPLNPMNASEEPLTGTTWKLVSWWTSQAPEKPLDQTQITLRFGENQINGSSGCNRYMAPYKITENQLKIASTASTRMACEEAVMRQESKFLSALQAAQSYEINSQGQLQIRYKINRNTGVLTFGRNP